MMGRFLDWDNEPQAIVADKAYGSTKIRQQIADEGALARHSFKKQCAKTFRPRQKSLCHVQHLRTLLLQNERHAKASDPLRKNRQKFPINAIHLRTQVLVQLIPHPSFTPA